MRIFDHKSWKQFSGSKGTSCMSKLETSHMIKWSISLKKKKKKMVYHCRYKLLYLATCPCICGDSWCAKMVPRWKFPIRISIIIYEADVQLSTSSSQSLGALRPPPGCLCTLSLGTSIVWADWKLGDSGCILRWFWKVKGNEKWSCHTQGVVDVSIKHNKPYQYWSQSCHHS